MEICMLYMKSGNIIDAEYEDYDLDIIHESFLNNNVAIIFNNCKVKSSEIEAIVFK